MVMEGVAVSLRTGCRVCERVCVENWILCNLIKQIFMISNLQ